MAYTFKKKPLSSIYRYSRPNISHYEDVNGDIIESRQNIIRLDHKDGYLYGIKFGDGDSMRIPLITNNAWIGSGSNFTFVITANAPVGYQYIQCGTFTDVGVGALKTTVHKVNPADLEEFIELFPDAPTFADDEGHVLIVKYYHEDIDFTQYEEYNAMVELNTFLHGQWG